jgi:hypothetical protein
VAPGTLCHETVLLVVPEYESAEIVGAGNWTKRVKVLLSVQGVPFVVVTLMVNGAPDVSGGVPLKIPLVG